LGSAVENDPGDAPANAHGGDQYAVQVLVTRITDVGEIEPRLGGLEPRDGEHLLTPKRLQCKGQGERSVCGKGVPQAGADRGHVGVIGVTTERAQDAETIGEVDRRPPIGAGDHEVDLVLKEAGAPEHKLNGSPRLAGIGHGQRLRGGVKEVGRSGDCCKNGCIAPPGVLGGFNHDVRGALGRYEAGVTLIERLCGPGAGRALLRQVGKDRGLQGLGGAGDHYVGLATGDEPNRTHDRFHPARFGASKREDGAPHPKSAGNRVAVGDEKRRLPGRSVGKAVGNGETAGVTRSGSETGRGEGLEGGIKSDGRAAIEEVAQVCRDVAVGAVVVRDGCGEERTLRPVRNPVAPGGQAPEQRSPCDLNPAPVGCDYPKAGDDRWGYRGLGLLRQLAKFLVEEFVVILLASPEHEGARCGRNQREHAEQLLHGNILLAPRPNHG
jgi:hypothetical protein